MKTKSLLIIRSAALPTMVLLLALAVPAFAVPPPSIDVTVWAQKSSPGQVIPLPPGTGQGQSGNPNQWFYEYTIFAGQSVVDTLPLQICTKSTPNGAGQTGYTLTLHFGPQNPPNTPGNLPGVSPPTDASFSSDTTNVVVNSSVTCPTAPMYNISLNTGPLDVGNYNALVEVQNSGTNPGNTGVQIHGKGIHIHVHVVPPPAITCFITDSDFNFLMDCNGQPVASGNGGRFAIVANGKKNIEVATNPGQFYYNVLWTNMTGSPQTVTVTFTRSGVNWSGWQAIHAMLFPSFPSFSAANFEDVNSAIPSGHDDALESVPVPAGYTLWVDYHLDWAGLGSAVPLGIGTMCSAANQSFSVTATVSGVNIQSVQCTAGALGYKK